jgi:phosphoribosylglycinamide formyltransferase 1
LKNIAIFASGTGSNAQKIISYFSSHPQIRVAVVASNNPQAYVLEIAKQAGIPTYTFNRQQFYESEEVIRSLHHYQIDWIVLAGFLWLVPLNLIRQYPDKIINIHPALLPRFGGKGMYGAKVHQAVVDSKEQFSGITIHLINEQYDKGEIVFQTNCPVKVQDTPADVAHKVQALEHLHFAPVIEKLITKSVH